MYSTQELIILSARKNKLNQLFTETMSDLQQKTITIQDASHTNLADILNQLNENDLFITNDNYINEQCDFQVFNKKGKLLLVVSEDGSLINNLDQADYLDESTCELLAKIYNMIKTSDNIFIVTEAA